MLLTVSQRFFFVLCLCLIYSDLFVSFNPVPFAVFDSREVKNLIYFPPQCRALFFLVPLFLSVFFSSSFPINLLLLSVTVVSCALWIFSLFTFDPPWQNNIICQNRSVSELSLLSLTHKHACPHTHTHALKRTYTWSYSDAQTPICISLSTVLYTCINTFPLMRVLHTLIHKHTHTEPAKCSRV